MLIPRFSIRAMLALTTGCAILFLIARQAMSGSQLAMSILMIFIFAGMLFGLFAIFFVAAYFFSALGRRDSEQSQSPFAQDRLPPQVIPPREVE